MALRSTRELGNAERIKSAAAAGLIHLLLGYALIVGLGVPVAEKVERGLALFDITPAATPAPPLPKSIPAPAKDKRPEGAASPPNLHATPTEIVAPTPPIPLPVPPPVVAAPIAGLGAAPSAGAADIRGPGTGSGGQGTGTGSGDSGDGTGGGGGGSGLRWLRGEITPDDYPRRALESGISGTVFLRFVVGVDGRVADCRVIRSSGNAELDETTCRLIRKRFRYRPKTDASGRRVPAIVTGDHEWRTTRRPDLVIEEPADDELRR